MGGDNLAVQPQNQHYISQHGFQSPHASDNFQGYPIDGSLPQQVPVPPAPPQSTGWFSSRGRRNVVPFRNESLIKSEFTELKDNVSKCYDHYAKSSSSSSSYRCCRSRSSFFIFSSGPSYSRGGRDDSSNALLALIFGIGGVIASYVAGKELGHLGNCDDALRNTRDLTRHHLNDAEYTIVSKASSVLQKIRNSSITSLILKIVLAAGFLIGAIGAGLGSASLFGFGSLAVLGAGVGLAVNAGIHASNRFNSEMRNRLNGVMQDINRLPQA